MATEKYDHIAAIDALCGLRRLEETYYFKASATPSEKSDCGSLFNVPQVATFRNEITRWYFEVAYHFRFRSETVAVAISCLDRFLAAQPPTVLKKHAFRLASLTTLYIVAKAYEKPPITLDKLVMLGEGRFTKQDFVEMELIILNALSWRVSDPTSIGFVRRIVCTESEIIPTRLIPKDEDRNLVIEVAQTQIRLALCDHSFVPIPASIIAFGALMNSLPSVLQQENFIEHLDELREILLVALGLEHLSKSRRKRRLLWNIQERLRNLVVKDSTEIARIKAEEKQQSASDVIRSSTNALEPVNGKVQTHFKSPRSTYKL